MSLPDCWGAFGFGQAADQSAFAPKGQLTAIVDNCGPYYIERTQAVLDGGWQSHGLKEGMVQIAPFGALGSDQCRCGIDRAGRDHRRHSPSLYRPRSWISPAPSGSAAG